MLKTYLIPNTKEIMLNEYFWINKIKDHDKIIMTQEQIEQFNAETVKKVDAVYNLREYKDSLTKQELLNFIEFYSIPSKAMYDIRGNEVKQEFYDEIRVNTNVDEIKEINPVKWGISVRNTSIRSFPTDEGVFKKNDDIEFDRFQQTACQAIEPIAILHESKDKKWYFVQMYNYRGWAKSEDIAVAKDKDEVFNYLDTNEFLTVTGNYVKTQKNHHEPRVSRVEFYMGTRIPLEKDESLKTIGNQMAVGNYIIKLPVRDDKGYLEFKTALISIREDVTVGYLPYTRKNIIRQAFKLLGDRYDWGDRFNGRDCSSTIMNIYKTFGFRLPRNANEQERGAGKAYKFIDGSTVEERNKLLKKVKPGAAIFMDGHVMIYLGEDDKKHYIIHNFHGYGEKTEEGYKFVPVNGVAVTPVLLLSSSGKTYLEKFTTVIEFEL
jgi:hypothetical protein